MRLKWVQLVVVIVSLAVAGILVVVYISRSRSQGIERYSRAYEAIEVGDSRDAVISAMGEPHEVIGCPYTPFADPKEEAEFFSKCFQEYEYVELMARYTISFDRNGAVIYKSKSVSP